MVVISTYGLVTGVIVISQAPPILQQAPGYVSARAVPLVNMPFAYNVVGRLMWGSLSDRLGPINIIGAVFLLCILPMAALVVTEAKGLVFLFIGAAASCHGGPAPFLIPLVAHMSDPRHITENCDVMCVVFGLASLTGPNLVITLKVVGGSSHTSAHVAAVVLAVTGLTLFRFLRAPSRKGE